MPDNESTTKVSRVLVFDKPTPHTLRFKPGEDEQVPPICKMLYLEKWVLGGGKPDRLKITIEIPNDTEEQPAGEQP